MLKICYYDNILCKINPPEVIFPFVRELLDWVDRHDAFLTIKTKTKWFNSRRSLLQWSEFTPLRSKLKLTLKVILGYKLPKFPVAKNIYKDYPGDIKMKLAELVKKKKLVFKFKPGDLTSGLEADVVVVIPHGHIALALCSHRKDILFFRHSMSAIRNITFFEKASDIKGLLDKYEN